METQEEQKNTTDEGRDTVERRDEAIEEPQGRETDGTAINSAALTAFLASAIIMFQDLNYQKNQPMHEDYLPTIQLINQCNAISFAAIILKRLIAHLDDDHFFTDTLNNIISATSFLSAAQTIYLKFTSSSRPSFLSATKDSSVNIN